ncbi:MAG: deazaflavin-dependent nitroreductase [Chloroflexota bacterium]|nr:deazaflavin-dependent nitroreductase [Chloroflexota bacterium]
MAEPTSLPGWLKIANPIFMTLIRLGVPVGTQHILTVRGRKTGRPYSTPVSLVTVDGQRYICSFPWTGWVKNARVVGEAELARGRSRQRVRLTELVPEERVPVLREFPVQVPHGVQFFQVPPDPQAFARAAPRLAVFRLEPMPATPSSSLVGGSAAAARLATQQKRRAEQADQADQPAADACPPRRG